MTQSELSALDQQPVAPLFADHLPDALGAHVAAYNTALEAFRDSVRQALEVVQSGGTIHPMTADALRACAIDLVTARAWVVRMARAAPDSSTR
jgi:hypothetical protein